MAYNIGFTVTPKLSKPDNLSKAVGSQSDTTEKTSSFRDSFKEAVRNRYEDNRGQDNRKTGENSVLRKELVRKSESKLKSIIKPETKKNEKLELDTEGNEKQLEELSKAIEELLAKLEELPNPQQMSVMQTNTNTAILGSIKELLSELSTIQTKSAEGIGADLQVKTAELTAVLEGMQNELKVNGNLIETKALVDFKQELKSVIAETSVKLNAEVEPQAEVKPQAEVNPQASSKISENLVMNANSSKVEQGTEEKASMSSKVDNSVELQKPEKTDNLKAEIKITDEVTEKQPQSIKAEVPAAENKSVTKEMKPALEKETDEGKMALESKVGKVTVENKESKKQDTEDDSSKETAHELPKIVKNSTNKTVNDEFTAIRLEQAEVDNKLEVVQKQTTVPKTEVVNKTEVINQIVKKAELVITDAQSELRMQLEPENLGKLSLKLAVEKGLITAKFVAESYEVKQIIESSFNELKDMLQEKGMEVQNFSVTVGENSQENSNNNSFQQWKETVKLNGRSMSKGSYDELQAVGSTTVRAANPYSIHNGTFDYRA